MLKDLTIVEFTKELASSSPAPGGGSASGVAASLASSLANMVVNLTLGNKVSEAYTEDMLKELNKAKEVTAVAAPRFLELMDNDTKAFLGYMDAIRMPKASDEEKAVRKEAIETAKRDVLGVPRSLANEAVKIFDSIDTASTIGNPSAISDAGVASLLLDAAVKGAVYNVKINLPMLKDEELKKEVFAEAEELNRISTERSGKIFEHVTKTLNSQI